MHRRIARIISRILTGAALVFLAGQTPAMADAVEVRSIPVPLNAENPEQKIIGKLTYRAGFRPWGSASTAAVWSR